MELVERIFVRDVDGGEAKTPFALVAVENVVVADGGIEQAARRDPRRVLVVVLGVGRRDADPAGSELRGEAGCGQGVVGVALIPLHAKPASNSSSPVSPLRSTAGCPFSVVEPQSVFAAMAL